MPGEFEQKVQQRMAEMELQPGAALWQKIESQLPRKKRRRYFIPFLLLLGLATTAVLTWPWMNETTVEKPALAKQPQPGTTASLDIPAAEKSGNTKQEKMSGIDATTTTQQDTDQQAPSGKQVKQTAHGNRREKLFVQKAKSRMLLTSAPTGEETDITGDDMQEQITEQIAEPAVPVDSIATTKIPRENKPVTDTSVPAIAKKSKSGKNIDAWQTGFSVGAGIAMQRSKVMRSNLAADPSSGGVTQPPVFSPLAPKPGVALFAGCYASKQLNKHWRFQPALQYQFLQTRQPVGAVYDTAQILNFGNYNSVYSSSTYSNGASGQYKNNYHSLGLQMMFELGFAEGMLYAEAGPAMNWLLHSNALVPHNGRLVTHPKMFRDIQLAGIAGIGINAGRSRIPFAIGARMQYNFSAVTKNGFTAQKLMATSLYLRVPFHKK